MRKVRPDLDQHIILGQPDVIPSAAGTYSADTTKAKKELGLKCKFFYPPILNISNLKEVLLVIVAK